jgi:putative heme transporter
VTGIEKLASLAFFLAMTVLSLFFLLKDGPRIRSWTERHLGVPTDVARTVTDRTLQSLRGYFLGVTIVATFSALLVGGGALALGVPLAGTIAVVTFVGGYVPYLGAWAAGAFSVLLALGGAGPEEAGGMVVIQLLSNGPLQQIVQLTIAGGALFGTVGLILAAPIASAIVRISADLSRARAESAT